MADHEFTNSSGDARLPDELVGRLRADFAPDIQVPEDVDRAILSSARELLDGQNARVSAALQPVGRTALRRLSIPAALAAAILLGLWLARAPREVGTPAVRRIAQNAVTREDLDFNGQVDILEAFLLAQELELNIPLDADWDMNGDGRVTYDDVHVIAQSAVRLTRKG